MRTRRNRLGIIVLGILAAIIVFIQVYGAVLRDRIANPPPEKIKVAQTKAAEILASLDPSGTLGNPQASVKVVAFFPIAQEEHQKTAELLVQFVKKHPREVYLTLLPRENPQSADKAAALGIQQTAMPGGQLPATIMINKNTEFTLKGMLGDTRQVSLTKMPNKAESSYRSDDVILILEQELAKLPGKESK